MHTKQQQPPPIGSKHFLVNGIKCELSIDRESLAWIPLNYSNNKSNGKVKRVNFDRVIGCKRRLPVDGRRTSITCDHCIEATENNSDNSNLVGSNKLNEKNGDIHECNQKPNGLSPSMKRRGLFDCRKGARIKVYYSKQNENKSSCQLLKLKKLIIEPIKASSLKHLQLESSSIKLETNIEIGVEPVAEQKFDDDDKNVQLQSATIDNQQKQQQSQLQTDPLTANDERNKISGAGSQKQAESGPPSCYASEGSNSRLSSLRSSSSSSASKLARSNSNSSRKSCSGSGEGGGVGDDTNPPTLAVQTPSHDDDNDDARASWSTTTELLVELAKQIEASLKPRRKYRPKRLLVFVNPFGGKGRATQLYESQVSRLLDVAGVEAKLVVTKYANHARDTIEDSQFNIEQFDGIVCVGGDGMFSELMNGLLFRYNRDQILTAELKLKAASGGAIDDDGHNQGNISANNNNDNNNDCNIFSENQHNHQQTFALTNDNNNNSSDTNGDDIERQKERQLVELRLALGGIGHQFVSPPIPVGVIGAGSTDANSFGLIGTNDVITATLNIILGNQINIDVCSVHSFKEDRLLRFVSTFVAYGYFGDVIRESEKLRWLGPSRYDVTGFNNLIKNRTYKGSVRILISGKDGSPQDLDKCHANCDLCRLNTNGNIPDDHQHHPESPCNLELSLVEKRGSFVGVNAAITACRCPQTKKGFSPNNHLANGCADLILVRPCSRIQYIQYLIRTGWTKKSAFDLKYVEAYRCRQFEFVAQEPRGRGNSSSKSSSSSSSSSTSSGSIITDQDSFSSWNVDGEILDEQSVRVKVNNRLLRVFGTGEPS